MDHKINNMIEKMFNFVKKHFMMLRVFRFGDKSWDNVIFEPVILKRCQKNKDNHIVPDSDFFASNLEDYL